MLTLLLTGLLSAQAEDAPLEDKGDRVRWGLSVNLGWALPYKGFRVGGELRLGYQVTRQFSAFAIAAASTGISPAFFLYGGAIVEYQPTDFFYVGGGPVVAWGRPWAEGLVTLNEVGLYGVGERNFKTGLNPGLDVRLGLTTGVGRPPTFRRGGFNIGIDALLLVHPDTQLSWAQGPGRPLVQTTETIVTFTPMLTLGYDAR